MSLAKKRLFLLELNEFSLPLLREGSELLGLEGIRRILSFSESTTGTSDTIDSQLLDPWVQWVSVHTGKAATEHGVRHLGQPPSSEHEQIWERLARAGYTVGVWGAMNATFRSSKKPLYFVPDPWTFSEKAQPEKLGGFVELPRYAARNYLKLRPYPLIKGALSFLRSNLSLSNIKRLLLLSPFVLARLIVHPFKAYPYFTVAEYCAARACLASYREHKPDFCLLFLNCLAHVQHYYWKPAPVTRIAEIRFVLRIIDDLILELLESLSSDTTLVVMNGFSQRNTSQDEPWVMYRQIDHGELLASLGVSPSRVEPLMTHDAHLFFPTKEKTLQALGRLKAVTIFEEPLFYVEEMTDTQLFYRIAFTKPAPKDATFECDGVDHLFFDHFKTIVQRTGVHIQRGSIFCSDPIFPQRLQNFETFHTITQFFENKDRHAGQKKAV